MLEKNGFHFLIPHLVHAFNQLQSEAADSLSPKHEIKSYYNDLMINSNKSTFIVTGIIGMGKSHASLLLTERFLDTKGTTPFAVTNIRQLESFQVLPNIKMTILVDGLFDQITTPKNLYINISGMNKFMQLLNNWSENNTLIISMEKEVLNFLQELHLGVKFLQKSFIVDFTDKVKINPLEIFTHIRDMEENCFACLSTVLLNPGYRFQFAQVSHIFPCDFFRNDYMIQEKVAESFVGIYLRKIGDCFYIKDERIRDVLCNIHLERNPKEFLNRCPLKCLCDFLMDATCTIKDDFLEIVISRLIDDVKEHPSHSLFKDFARLCTLKNFYRSVLCSNAVKTSLSQIQKTYLAHMANQLVESGCEDCSFIIQMLVNDSLLFAKKSCRKSYDDLQEFSDENVTPYRSSFVAIDCEFDHKKYKWGQKTKINNTDGIPNKVLEYLLKSNYMADSLLAKIFLRAIEQNFCSEFSVSHTCIWTGYRIEEQSNTCKRYVTVVRKERIKIAEEKVLPLSYCGLDVLVKGNFESLAIMEDEAKYNLDRNLVLYDWIITNLLRDHSNITGITTSPILSMNYSGDEPHKIKPISCVVITCHTKGVIPMGEKQFPRNINGYPVDVRESCEAISAIHPPQKGDSIKSSTEGMGVGTLGGFVFVGQKIIYYLTAAHVLVLKHYLNENLCNVANTLDVKILRKVSKEWKECGKLERGYFGEIQMQRKVTVDAVLVSVNSTEHEPKDAFLPQENVINAGFFEGKKPYFIGKIRDVSSLDKQLIIVKYEQATSWTKGSLTSINTMKCTNIDLNGSFTKYYYGQLVVKSERGKFADLGDSGSLVFIVEDYHDPELQCIGLLNAVDQMTFEVFVTPIKAVLESLRLDENSFKNLDPPFSLKYFNIIKETLALHTDILLNLDEKLSLQV